MDASPALLPSQDCEHPNLKAAPSQTGHMATIRKVRDRIRRHEVRSIVLYALSGQQEALHEQLRQSLSTATRKWVARLANCTQTKQALEQLCQQKTAAVQQILLHNQQIQDHLPDALQQLAEVRATLGVLDAMHTQMYLTSQPASSPSAGITERM